MYTPFNLVGLCLLTIAKSVPNPGFYTPENYERAYRFLEWMTKRIHTNDNYTTVGMLEVLNEPVHVAKWKAEAADMIKNYYPNAFKRIQAMEGYLKVASADRLHIQFMVSSLHVSKKHGNRVMLT